MSATRRAWILRLSVGLVVLAVGGLAGWWLAMRSMPMDGTSAGRGLDAEPGSSGMSDMAGMGGMRGSGAERGPAGGPALVRVDPVRLQRIGVRYAVARREPFGRTVRAEAAVAYDEGRKAYVTTKVGGWVEELFVNEPGQAVRRGQPLLEIYSPELVSTQRELLLALEHARRSPPTAIHDSTGPGAGRSTDDALSASGLVDAARRRLQLWDIPPSEIARLIRTGEVQRTLTLVASASGVVIEKDVLEGGRIEPGENLFLLADLATVWVEARVFEDDLAGIGVGDPATITLQAYPGETFTGTVSFVYPYLDPTTRTATVRIEVPNPEGRIKPGMFATVSLEGVGEADAVVVPSSAVIQTGERAFVLVKRGAGVFEPREVVIGRRSGDEVAIAENLAAGDTVVASANFLIDSEANLMAYMGGMLGMGMRGDQMRMDTGATEEGTGEMKGLERGDAGDGERPQRR